MKSRAFKWRNCLEIKSFGTVFRIYFSPRKCKIAHILSLVTFWPCEMTSRRVESSDVAGVTCACSNLQILFTSIPQFAAVELFCVLREEMPNRYVAAGCSNVLDPSRSIGLHKFPEDNDSERKRRRLWIAFVRTKRAKWSPTDASHIHAHVHNILKPMISKAHLLQFQGRLSLVARF